MEPSLLISIENIQMIICNYLQLLPGIVGLKSWPVGALCSVVYFDYNRGQKHRKRGILELEMKNYIVVIIND